MTRQDQDNRGITLVELMVSISISVIVIASITYLVSYSSRNYKKASEEVALQTEAQILIGQLNDLIMASYNVKYSGNLLTIRHEDVTYLIEHDIGTQELLFEKVPAGSSPTGDKALFGRYVKELHITDTGSDNSNHKIEIFMELQKGSRTFSIQDNTITIRNRIKP